MKQLQKSKRYENEEYLNFIRSKSCCTPLLSGKKCDGVKPGKQSAPHHMKSKGAGGSDLKAVPMCRFHHGDFHNIGITTFQTKYQIDLKEVQRECMQEFIEMKFPM